MRIYFLSLLILYFFMPSPAEAKRLHPEVEYQTYWCNKNNGIIEFQLKDKSRVDCLTDSLAVEVDFANKWSECIGQALYYGSITKKQPACLLILENGDKDLKYLKRLRKTAYKKGVNVKTFTIKPENLK